MGVQDTGQEHGQVLNQRQVRQICQLDPDHGPFLRGPGLLIRLTGPCEDEEQHTGGRGQGHVDDATQGKRHILQPCLLSQLASGALQGRLSRLTIRRWDKET